MYLPAWGHGWADGGDAVHRYVSAVGAAWSVLISGQQGKGKVAAQVACIQGNVGEADRGDIDAFVHIEVVCIVIVLAAKQPLDAFGEL